MPLIEQILAVAFVLGLLMAALWAAGRRSGGFLLPLSRTRSSGEEAIRVVQRIPLTPQHCLHLLKTEKTTLLIGTHPSGIVFAPQDSPFHESLRQAWRTGTEEER